MVRLCVDGMRAEAEGRLDVARARFAEAWASRRNDVDACIAAHYLARHQDDPRAMLHWNEEALRRADAASDPLVRGFYPSLYLNLGWSHEQLGAWPVARHWYGLAERAAASLPGDGYGETVRGGVAAGLRRLAAVMQEGRMGLSDEHYENPKLAAIYDRLCGWSQDRDFYLALAGDPPQRILDLGCGTGLLCDAYAARGHSVTGADPTPAMLAVARQKPHGGAVEWVQASAQEFRSERRFDLIIMTGHAFQVMLGDDDVRATLATMRRHLKPEGRAVFESRNPAVDWAAEWNGTEELSHQGVPIRYTTEVLSRTGDRVTFEQRFAFPDETLVSFSELRFLPKEAIEAHLAAAGLEVEALYGDWDSSPFDPASSHEMIFVARPAER